MRTLISELPVELQLLVHQRQIEQGNTGTFMGELSLDYCDGNFTWDKTPEGDLFWQDINEGRDVTNTAHYPPVNTIVNNFPIH